MTHPCAIRHFIAICGGDCIAKGARWEEPLRRPPTPVAFIMGQCDYVADTVHQVCPSQRRGNPFALGTPDAAYYAAGRFRERKDERSVVEAYVRNQHHD